MTPYGPLYDSTLWRQAGGNPLVYEQLAEQKAWKDQMKAEQLLPQQMATMQKQAKDGQLNAGTRTNPNPVDLFAQPRRRKERATLTPKAEREATTQADATTKSSSDAAGDAAQSRAKAGPSTPGKTEATETDANS